MSSRVEASRSIYPLHSRQELDHYTDPLGTESHNVESHKKKGPKVDLLEAVYDEYEGIPMKSITIRNWFK